MIVLISELAKRSDRLGGLVAALPLLSIISLIWLHVEQQPSAKIADHEWYTFWYVLPTLPMFALFPFLLGRVGFWPTLLISAMITLFCFVLLAIVVRRFGIILW